MLALQEEPVLVMVLVLAPVLVLEVEVVPLLVELELLVEIGLACPAVV